MDQIWPNRNGTKRKRIFEIAKHCSWQKPAPKSSHPPPASFAHRTASSWPSPRNSSSLEPKNAAPLGQRKPNCNHLNLGVGTCRDPCIPGTPHEHLKRQRNIVELWHVCSSFAFRMIRMIRMDVHPTMPSLSKLPLGSRRGQWPTMTWKPTCAFPPCWLDGSGILR